MDITTWEPVDVNHFRVFIRDLGLSTGTNLKHMIQDAETSEILKQSQSSQSVRKNKQKKQAIKKKDLIIQANTERLAKKRLHEDLQKVAYFFENVKDSCDPYADFQKLETPEAKTEYKARLLEHYWKKENRKKNLMHVINLYYHLSHSSCRLDHTILPKIKQSFDKYAIKSYMLEKMGHLLPPLNFWDTKRTLDEWQSSVIQAIKQRKSVLVRAPTSAGKTFVAMATGILHQRVLYVCPAKPVAYQVGAAFVKMGYRVHYLVENHSDLSYDKQTNIFVGVPSVIEECLPKIGISYDYAVFDEIHTLNDYDSGVCYENIVKLLDCPFLALSATIQNIEYLREIFERYGKSPMYVEYSHRFINQQRWVYEGSLRKIHPISCVDFTDSSSLNDIAMTPNDLSRLYEALEEAFEEDLEDLDPDEYFTDETLLTLDGTKRYESVLKARVFRLYESHPEKMLQIKESLCKGVGETCAKIEGIPNLVPLFKKCRKVDLFPMLYFHTNETVVRELFVNLEASLRKQELQDYPFHYKLLEKKDELFRAYRDKRAVFESNLKIKRTTDALTEKEAKLEKFDKEQKNHFIGSVVNYYDSCIQQCGKLAEGLRDVAVKNLLKSRKAFMKHPDFRGQDIFQKHPDYCFTKGEPMSGEEIKGIRREIKRTGYLIEYENPLFQLLKRGIGVYLESFPDEYNRVVQRLLSQKKLGVVLSDRTLCLGIDLPIRTVAFSGYKDPQYSTSDYLQMSGRAGRRGHDNQGNIIFHNVPNCLALMKGSLPSLTGSAKPIYEGYRVLGNISQISVKPVCGPRICSDAPEFAEGSESLLDYGTHLNKLLWILRYDAGGEDFVKSLVKFEKRIFREPEDLRETFLLQHILETLLEPGLYEIYQRQRIDERVCETVNSLRKLGDIARHMVRTLNPVTYKITIHHSKIIFDKTKTLVFKYRLA